LGIVDPTRHVCDYSVCDYSGGPERVNAAIDDAYSAVMVEVVYRSGGYVDPVELQPPSARLFATGLLILAERLDAHLFNEVMAGKQRTQSSPRATVTLQRTDLVEMTPGVSSLDFSTESNEISIYTDAPWAAHTKVVNRSGGPVALDPAGARRLATALLTMADHLD